MVTRNPRCCLASEGGGGGQCASNFSSRPILIFDSFDGTQLFVIIFKVFCGLDLEIRSSSNLTKICEFFHGNVCFSPSLFSNYQF